MSKHHHKLSKSLLCKSMELSLPTNFHQKSCDGFKWTGSSRMSSSSFAHHTRSRLASPVCLTIPRCSNRSMARWAVVKATFNFAAAPLMVRYGLDANSSTARTGVLFESPETFFAGYFHESTKSKITLMLICAARLSCRATLWSMVQANGSQHSQPTMPRCRDLAALDYSSDVSIHGLPTSSSVHVIFTI